MSSTWFQPSHFLEIIYENPGLAMNLLNNWAKVKIGYVWGGAVASWLRMWLTNHLGVHITEGLEQGCADPSSELSRERLLAWCSNPTATTSACLGPWKSLQSLSLNFLGSQWVQRKQWQKQQQDFLQCRQLRHQVLSPGKQPIYPLKDGFDFSPTFQPSTGMKLHHFPSLQEPGWCWFCITPKNWQESAQRTRTLVQVCPPFEQW